jgi:hypothetical protein
VATPQTPCHSRPACPTVCRPRLHRRNWCHRYCSKAGAITPPEGDSPSLCCLPWKRWSLASVQGAPSSPVARVDRPVPQADMGEQVRRLRSLEGPEDGFVDGLDGITLCMLSERFFDTYFLNGGRVVGPGRVLPAFQMSGLSSGTLNGNPGVHSRPLLANLRANRSSANHSAANQSADWVSNVGRRQIRSGAEA